MFHAKLYIFQTILSGMFKAEYIAFLWIYIHIIQNCVSNY